MLIVVGVTYALWTTTKKQSDVNRITNTCLKMVYESKNLEGQETKGITLEKAFPIIDEDGKKLEGYTFTIKNECNSYVDYSINLESLNTIQESQRIGINSLKIFINDEPIKTLNNYETTDKILDNSYDARKLTTGTLEPVGTSGAKREYTLRMWLDDATPESEMNKSYESKITVYGEVSDSISAVNKIRNIAAEKTTSELRNDETVDRNIRYIGKDPHNYVRFNDELWRIIGVMNNVEDGSGNKDTRVKLIKAEGIGQISWDNRCDNVKSETEIDHCISSPNYKNKWDEAKLQKLLNGPYLNSVVSTEYNRWTKELKGFGFGSDEESIRHYEKIDFTNTGIKEKYRDMIDIVKYNLGGPVWDDGKENSISNLNSNLFYNIERSNYVYSGNKTEWIGQIGLIYPSDYGFATSGGVGLETWSDKEYTTTLETCMTEPIKEWYSDENLGCRDNNWLYQGEKVFQWTISPYADNDYRVTLVDDDGYVYDDGYYDPCDAFLVRPVLYLKSEVKIVSGRGTKDDPFTLAI